jgi:hypothetical protein
MYIDQEFMYKSIKDLYKDEIISLNSIINQHNQHRDTEKIFDIRDSVLKWKMGNSNREELKDLVNKLQMIIGLWIIMEVKFQKQSENWTIKGSKVNNRTGCLTQTDTNDIEMIGK